MVDDGPAAITDFPGPVSSGRYVPGTSLVVLTTDTGGDERHQLSLLDLDDPPGADVGKLTKITDDPRFVHGLAGVSRDGRHLAFVSNRRNGVDFDVWLHDRASGDERCLYDAGGWCSPASGFSPDGTWLSVRRAGPRPMDNDVLLLPTAGAEAPIVVLPHTDEPAVVGAPAWVTDDLLLVSSNVGRDFSAVFALDLPTGISTPVLEILAPTRTGTPMPATSTAGRPPTAQPSSWPPTSRSRPGPSCSASRARVVRSGWTRSAGCRCPRRTPSSPSATSCPTRSCPRAATR